MYRVIKHFVDLQDNGHKYRVGDEFPREGLKVSEERIEELASDKNRRKIPLIEKVEDEVVTETDEVVSEDIPEESQGEPKEASQEKKADVNPPKQTKGKKSTKKAQEEGMIEQVLDFIHNYFEKDRIRGNFDITDGNVQVDFLLEGQYFKIVGSVLNDGVYQYPATELRDETFKGEIWSLAIPKAVLDLVTEISDWQATYGAQANSPFQSESFGGYSYTKASGTNGNGGSAIASWQSTFGTRLNAYRKIS